MANFLFAIINLYYLIEYFLFTAFNLCPGQFKTNFLFVNMYASVPTTEIVNPAPHKNTSTRDYLNTTNPNAIGNFKIF